MPFRYTINPYRGCSHACTYCFARPTHEYLGLNGAEDFERRIVVKVNAVERLARGARAAELGRRAHRDGDEHRSLPAVRGSLPPHARHRGDARRRARIPFSILTKSTMIQRDLDVLAAAAERTDVRVNFSIGTLDEQVWRISEPGTPPPRRRVEALARLSRAGIPCGVLVAPILPGTLGRRGAALGGRAGLHRGRRGLDLEHRPAPAPGRARALHALARARAPRSRRALREALQRAQRLPRARGAGAHRRARARAGASGTAAAPGARAMPVSTRRSRCAARRRRCPLRRPSRPRSCGSSADAVQAGMPLQNRVTPFSELVADPARGLLYGNRGCMHDDSGRIRRRYGTRRWIACRLEFRGWQRGPLLQPGLFTELFFLDEVTAFAAGHRPCALCRRADYVRLGEIWRELHPGQVGADAIDLQLHGERVAPARARSCTTARRSTSSPTARSSCARARPGSCSDRSCCAGRPPGYPERVPRPRDARRDRDHAALAGGRPARRMVAARAAAASLGRGLRRSGSVRIGRCVRCP